MTTYFRNHPLTYYGKTPKKIGDGTYSKVYKYKARKKRAVAVKIHNNSTAFIREISLIDEFKGCPNIVDMLDVGYDFKRNNFYHIMPLAETDLYHQIQSKYFKTRPEKVKLCMYQILQALAFIHVKQYLHRDIKAENVLAFRELDGNIVYKLCDFGLSRKAYETGACYTSYMVTLYYRPPENILEITNYTYSIDVWSMGCIFVEIILGIPPFTDEESKDSLRNQLKALGSNVDLENVPDYLKDALSDISDEEFKEGKEWWNKNIKKRILDSVHSEAYDLIEKMLVLDPNKRISIREALLHPYFKEYSPVFFPLLPIFKVYKPEDWSFHQSKITWKNRKDSLIKIHEFIEHLELNDVVFVKTIFLFNLFANRDTENHLTEDNIWSYMLVIVRIASKLCCGDPITLSKIIEFIPKKKIKERTRYFLNRIGFKPSIYTGYDWLIEPRNKNRMRLEAFDNGIKNEENWEKVFYEIRGLYTSSLFYKELFYNFEPKELVEACYTYILKSKEIPEIHRNIHSLLKVIYEN